jgi:heavy metal sensor kinase
LNPRSIRFRLVAWCACLSVLVMLGFGGYTYRRLEAYLQEVSESALQHRAETIARTLLADVPKTGEQYVNAQINARYNPSLNDKFVRIVRGDGSLLYLSDAPADRSFEPSDVPLYTGRVRHTFGRLERSDHGSELLISAVPFESRNASYLVEVGASTIGSRRVLHGLVVTLAAGLPVLLALVVFGGYVLIARSLAPVNNIMQAARDITLHHLGRRLPVPDTRDEIASLSQVLNQMIARLDESFEHTSRFTADASHELRTPLTIIKGELEALIFRKDIDTVLRDELFRILEEVERLVKIVESLFALSRLDSGEGRTERVRLDLASLAETTAEQMCLLAVEKRITIHYPAKEPVEVEGDRSRLKQVIVNLLDNAVKYTPSGGAIAIAVRAQGGFAFLEVSDSGPGVPEAAIPHLFDRFYRADGVRSRDIDGAGLGLAIVRSICNAHGGSITAANTPPQGCCFTVRLPLACSNFANSNHYDPSPRNGSAGI